MEERPWADWMQRRAPDVEGLLARLFSGSGLLQGGASDYAMALAIACAFPAMRFFMDRCVYGVRSACLQSGPSCCLGFETPAVTPATSLQPLAHRVLRVPAGDPKRTDVSRDQLDTLEKFKGECCDASAPCCWPALQPSRLLPLQNPLINVACRSALLSCSCWSA